MEKIKSMLAVLGGLCAGYARQHGKLYWLVAVAIALDLMSGLFAAAAQGKGFSSRTAGKGLMKKFTGLLAVVCGTFLDVVMPFVASMAGVKMDMALHFSAVISAYICVTESISVLENIYLAGGKMPRKITDLLAIAKEKMEK